MQYFRVLRGPYQIWIPASSSLDSQQRIASAFTVSAGSANASTSIRLPGTPLAVSANYLCHSDKYCFTVPSPATGHPRFIPNSQKPNKTRFMVNLSGTEKSQISCRCPPTEVSESLAPSPFKKRNPSLPEKLEARQLAAAGCKSGRSGPWLISPGKTFSIICVMLTLEQKHDPIPRVARSDR